MSAVEQLELSLDVGRKARKPDVASFKVGGSIGALRQLDQDSSVVVSIIDPDGEIIASAEGTINVGFKKHKATSRSPAYTERVHSIALD